LGTENVIGGQVQTLLHKKVSLKAANNVTINNENYHQRAARVFCLYYIQWNPEDGSYNNENNNENRH
jgi:hypothetical protein